MSLTLGSGGARGGHYHFRKVLVVIFQDKRHHWLFIPSDDSPIPLFSIRRRSERVYTALPMTEARDGLDFVGHN